jgi:hypothetical protein
LCQLLIFKMVSWIPGIILRDQLKLVVCDTTLQLEVPNLASEHTLTRMQTDTVSYSSFLYISMH